MEVAVTLPHCGEITGMGIRKGITVIVGGGFHGKSASADLSSMRNPLQNL